MNLKDMMTKGLFALLAILFICAIIELVIAAVVYGSAYSREMFAPLENGSGMIVLMTSAIIVIICTGIGAFGAKKNMKIPLLIFAGLTLVNFILQIAGFSVAFNSVTNSESPVHMYNLLVKYNNNADAKRIWDDTQKELSCCGVISLLEWGNANAIPNSCKCTQGDPNCSSFFFNTYIYDVGCYSVMAWFVYHLTLGVAGLSVAMAILQLFACGISLKLAKSASGTSMKV
ncbi:tetraspanin-33-like [Neocloeon triangulifer]|uniref:tetraspanin-33-like n=1 Tax=Neocloeon triangulifer TaxID=2078957 RepID=UPI00286F2D13|nr:tetraspanin-33-like [Neocloeon triangulifer]